MDEIASFRSDSPSLSVGTAGTSDEKDKDSPKVKPTLYQLLNAAELSAYYTPLTTHLKVRTCDHLKFVKDSDLLEIGMSKPEIRRLWKFYHRHCEEPGVFDRLKQTLMLGRKGSIRDKKKPASSYSKRTSADEPKSSPDKPTSPVSPTKSQQHHIIPARNMTLCKQLGGGEFGSVWQAVWSLDNGAKMQVAVKVVDAGKMPHNPLAFIHEAAVMHKIRHDNIVKLYGVVLETNTIMLVTELAPLRSLLECLRDETLRPSFPLDRLCSFAEQMCAGMVYLETNRFIHRDLAARNILVFSKDLVKICDFGLSKSLRVDEDYYRGNLSSSLRLPIAWCAPECINQLKFTSASDVWAYGVTLWEMFTYGFQPWAGLTGRQILEQIDLPKAAHLDVPDLCPSEYYSLMLQCWQHQPASRPKFEHIEAVLPTIRPERVLAVMACQDGQPDHLQYNVNNVITVLNKRPLEYPDGFFWKGVLSTGRTGLFQPTNTVAYIGVEYPSIPDNFKASISDKRATSPQSQTPDHPAKLSKTSKLLPTTSSSSSTPNSSRGPSAEKSLISGPIGPPRHTAHLGIDGACFGDLVSVEGPTSANTNLSSAATRPRNVVAPMPSATSTTTTAEVAMPTGHAPTPPPTGRTGNNNNNNNSNNNSNNNNNNNSTTTQLYTPINKQPQLVTVTTSTDTSTDTGNSAMDTSLSMSLLDDVFGTLNLDKKDRDRQIEEVMDGKNGCTSPTKPAPPTPVSQHLKPVEFVRPLSFTDERKVDRLSTAAHKLSNKSLNKEESSSRKSEPSPTTTDNGGMINELKSRIRSLGSTSSTHEDQVAARTRSRSPMVTTPSEEQAYSSWISRSSSYDNKSHDSHDAPLPAQHHNHHIQQSPILASPRRSPLRSPSKRQSLAVSVPDVPSSPTPPPPIPRADMRDAVSTTSQPSPLSSAASPCLVSPRKPPPVPAKKKPAVPPSAKEKQGNISETSRRTSMNLEISGPILNEDFEEKLSNAYNNAMSTSSQLGSPLSSRHADFSDTASLRSYGSGIPTSAVKTGIWAPSRNDDDYESSPLRSLHTDANHGIARMFRPSSVRRSGKFSSPPKASFPSTTTSTTDSIESSSPSPKVNPVEQTSANHPPSQPQDLEPDWELTLDMAASGCELAINTSVKTSPSSSVTFTNANADGLKPSPRSGGKPPPTVAPKPKFVGGPAPHPLLKKEKIYDLDDFDNGNVLVTGDDSNSKSTHSEGRRSARYQTNIDKYELLDFVLQPLNDKRKSMEVQQGEAAYRTDELSDPPLARFDDADEM